MGFHHPSPKAPVAAVKPPNLGSNSPESPMLTPIMSKSKRTMMLLQHTFDQLKDVKVKEETLDGLNKLVWEQREEIKSRDNSGSKV